MVVARRHLIAVPLALLSLGLFGCGQSAPLAGTAANSQAEALFWGPRLPVDRPLVAGERDGDFDRFLQVALGDAMQWDKGARLTGAQAVNVDRQGRKAGGTTYSYLFAAGRHGLAIAIAGQNVAFEKAKARPAVELEGLIPAGAAIRAALETGSLAGDNFVLALEQPQESPVPVFLVAEFRKGASAKVLVNARTGKAVVAPTNGQE